jgi:alkanesulfonate monooxygenase
MIRARVRRLRTIVYTTCPPSNRVPQPELVARMQDAARWSETYGCHGMLVYTDNGLVDPWLAAEVLLAATTRLVPLIAVQSVYLHPYSAAKLIASCAHLRQRRLDVNLVAGGFPNDLRALGDRTPHDQRYDRTVEFARILRGLVDGEAVSLQGQWWQVETLRLTPPVPAELRPAFLISGSSPAGLAAAHALGATAVCYPEPPASYGPAPADGITRGIRVGVLARPTAQAAWQVAHARFPPDRRGQLTHGLAMKVSDSHWHRQLGELARSSSAAGEIYWLHPFQNYQTFCPYLVGSHDQVAAVLAGYLRAGFTTLITDVPAEAADLEHLAEALGRAEAAVPA